MTDPDHIDIDASDVDWEPPRPDFVPVEVLADPDPADVRDSDKDPDS